MEQPSASGLGAFALVALAFLGTSACSGRDGASLEQAEAAGTGDSETMSVSDSSESDTTTTSDSTDTDDSSDGDTATSGSFYAGPEPDFSSNCDPFAQDCPDGEKCVPYSKWGGWDANKCVPVLGDAGPGEPCISAGSKVATDSCDATSVCWNYGEIDGELVGTCTPMCGGNPDTPECPTDTTCIIGHAGAIALCLDDCDPLMQDCPDNLACAWIPDSGAFSCVLSLDVGEGEPCWSANSCQPGSLCVDAALVPGCEGASCCTRFCSQTEPMCAPETECEPLFGDPPPPGHEDLGACVIPG